MGTVNKTRLTLTQNNAKLIRLIQANAPRDGEFVTAVPGLRLFRQSSPTALDSCVQAPALAVVAQGAKEIRLAQKVYRYGQGHCVVVSLGLPMALSVTGASIAKPYLGLRFDLDLDQLLSIGSAPEPKSSRQIEPILLSRVGSDLLDPLLRLLRLLSRPDDITVLAPLLHREILYRLTKSDLGIILRRFAAIDSEANRIRKAVAWIEANATRTFSMKALASAANMSASSVHHHFRAVTGYTPLNFQKHLRLNEARRLMVTHSLDASTAALRVGYTSPSQFSREYKRFFGESPARDTRAFLKPASR